MISKASTSSRSWAYFWVSRFVPAKQFALRSCQLRAHSPLAFLTAQVYLTRSFVDEQVLSLDDTDDEKDLEHAARRLMAVHRAAVIVAILTVAWITWSIVSIYLLSDHLTTYPSPTDCQYPEAAIFAYVGMLAVLSLLAGIYAVIVNANSVFRGRTADLRLSVRSRGGSLLFIPSPMGDRSSDATAKEKRTSESRRSRKIAPIDFSATDAPTVSGRIGSAGASRVVVRPPPLPVQNSPLPQGADD